MWKSHQTTLINEKHLDMSDLRIENGLLIKWTNSSITRTTKKHQDLKLSNKN